MIKIELIFDEIEKEVMQNNKYNGNILVIYELLNNRAYKLQIMDGKF